MKTTKERSLEIAIDFMNSQNILILLVLKCLKINREQIEISAFLYEEFSFLNRNL